MSNSTTQADSMIKKAMLSEYSPDLGPFIELINRWQSSIHTGDIGGSDERESVRAFTVQKCIEELQEAIGLT